jgi:multiple sugar transport system ATP-binding protein
MSDLKISNLYKRYGSVEILKDVNLDIKSGEFIVFVGPSGCGKSTLLRCISGLESISAGTLEIDGRVVNDVAPSKRGIAMVFQSYALYPHMTVYDNMAFGLRMRKQMPSGAKPGQSREAAIKQRVEEVADSIGLRQFLNRKPRQLSGGQRQRVALGRAIVRNPQVFLMDEPLSNLDAKLRVETRANIIKLHQRIQTTVVYVTHDQVEAMTMGDRIAVLNAGIIQQLGAPQELYDHPANLFVAGFIGTPSMNFFPGAKISASDGAPKIVLEGIGEVAVPQLYAERARGAAGKNLTFGIRPSHLEDANIVGANGATQSHIDGTVDVVENLGNELQVYLNAGGKNLVATLDPRSRVTPGNSVRLYVESEQIHLFDTDSGAAIF